MQMQKLKLVLFSIILLQIAISCENTSECCVVLEEKTNLTGKWQVYEVGYSPGDVYVTEQVAEDPAQIMNFEPGNQFSSNVEGLEKFRYYSVIEDTLSEGSILALHEVLPDNGAVSNLNQSYNIRYGNGNITLHFRFCIEGCHIGIKKIGEETY